MLDALPNIDSAGAGAGPGGLAKLNGVGGGLVPNSPPPAAAPDELGGAVPNNDLVGAVPDGFGDTFTLENFVHLWGCEQHWQRSKGDLSPWEPRQPGEFPYQVGSSIPRTRRMSSERLMPSWSGWPESRSSSLRLCILCIKVPSCRALHAELQAP